MRTTMARGLAGSAACLAALAVCAGPTGAQQYELSGDRVAIYNLAGDVTLEAAGGSSVVVQVTRVGPDGDALEIGTGPVAGQETLRVIYPADRIVYRPRGTRDGFHTTVRVRDDGTFGDGGRERRGMRGRRVEVRSNGSGFDGSADLVIRIPRGKRFAVYLGAGHVSASNIDGEIRIDTHAGGVTTSNTSGSLLIDTGSGRVQVTSASGDVDVDTGSGSVDVTGVNGAVLRVDTGSGSVVASRVSTGTLDIDTGSGRIDVSGTSAQRVRLDTGSGSIDAALTGTVESVDVDTGSGNVTLTLPASFSAMVEIETGSGGIDVGFPLEIRRWERDHVRGVIGSGSGRLVIDTGSGSVRIIQG